MSKDFYARQYSSSDISGTDAFAILSYTEAKIVVAAIAQLHFVNDPSFSGLKMKIYTCVNNRPGSLIATSTNSWTLATLKALWADSAKDNARKQTYFEFNEVKLSANQEYAFVLQADSYTGTDSSYIAWGINYPDEVSSDSENISYGNLANAGMLIALVGAAA
jgi:hypothetical protein